MEPLSTVQDIVRKRNIPISKICDFLVQSIFLLPPTACRRRELGFSCVCCCPQFSCRSPSSSKILLQPIQSLHGFSMRDDFLGISLFCALQRVVLKIRREYNGLYSPLPGPPKLSVLLPLNYDHSPSAFPMY